MLETLDCLSNKSILLLEKNRLLFPLIKTELIKSELDNLTIEKEIEKKNIEKIKEKYGLTDDEKFEEWLKSQNLQKIEFEHAALQNLKLQEFYQQNFSNKLDARFLKRKSQLDIIIYSIIRVKDPYKAQELYQRIIEKEACFEDLAAKYSEGIEKRTRGIVGPIEAAKTHPGVLQILRTSEPGFINQPLQVQGFYVVTRLESYDAAELDEFMRKKMGEELFNDYIETKSEELRQNILNKNPEK
ncbi:peptidylprolyl isomerase [Prochlorococcus marinus]|uniref:peptidylprolyl isomerase n=1 Tax=Prochlorococcus marinus XMU1408 TaxID=2213228 RepID=A0A318QY34_PROMR|nr:peptidylprolyl isomerase [Prochlorococcus marinus]MBW3042872.1 hypothetical protein [Prochlorococcus marinus str. XMU1408]PYE00698.1 hypothetical protein DNJ73_09145 [Prochlorococcus marinus XMU1408]